MWGELAWQLLGRDGYNLIAEADQQGVSPGSDALHDLFTAASPCLILVDEWVTYIRQLYEKINLPAGSFDTNLSFAQALTEAARATPQTLVVATLPAAEIEAGGEGGQEALERLRRVFSRVEASWRPADANESFEIVRRRLFQPLADPDSFKARDAVAKTFAELYRSQPQEFPAVTREASYERRLQASYPIHPELFDRLYSDWSTLEEFQRTRGVLRLMSAVIYTLWSREDQSPLILPSTVPIDGRVLSELTQYLGPNWVPIVEKDIDGLHSLPARLDSELTNLGRFGACRCVARTIYFGSAPMQNNPNNGLTDSQIRLGCAQPGHNVAIFGDALHRLTDQATHLYQNEKRYWYATQPSVTRLAQDRAAQYNDDPLYEEIERRLRKQQRGDFIKMHVCPASSADISDDESATRLIILKPQFSHSSSSVDHESTAFLEANKLPDLRGNAPRKYRNTLVFLTAERKRMEELKQAVRLYLAWKSIDDEHEILNLDASQRRQASKKHKDMEDTVEALIPQSYIWLLVPIQNLPQQPVTLGEYRLQPQDHSSLSENVSNKLRRDELLVTKLAGTRLRYELDRIPLWRGNHVSIKELAENFARYIYLPRLQSTQVLLEAIRNGVQLPREERETFAYADRWDEENARYVGLRVHEAMTPPQPDSDAVLVKLEIAFAQQSVERNQVQRLAPTLTHSYPNPAKFPSAVAERSEQFTAVSSKEETGDLLSPDVAGDGEQERLFHRFHGSVYIDERLMARDAGKIMEEVVRHLVGLHNAKVQVTLEIQADIPNGVPDNIERTVRENCRVLNFQDAGFELE